MCTTELQDISRMKYVELCDYLIQKYGHITESYFVNEKCKTANSKIKRSSEGLFIHHIKENEYIWLSKPQYAVQAPFECQMGENLVYCNYFEHLFLHIAIMKEYLVEQYEKNKVGVGVGGLFDYIIPEIIDYINGYEYKKEYMLTALKVIDGHEDFFAKVILDLYDYLENNEELSNAIWHVRFDNRRDKFDFYVPSVYTIMFEGKMIEKGRFNDIVTSVSNVNWSTEEDIKSRIRELSVLSDTTSYNFRKEYNPKKGIDKIYYLFYHKNDELVLEEYYLKNQIEYLKILEYLDEVLCKFDWYYINPNSIIKTAVNKKSKNKYKNIQFIINGNTLSEEYTEKQVNEMLKTYSEKYQK